jgi:hypothetical protein
MEKDNKLIAEFMGTEWHKDFFKDVCIISSSNISYKFHSSWDWLMPVVQKIGDEYLNTPFDETYSHLTEQYENIWTLEDTYKAVVEFIKDQKDRKDGLKK